MQTEGWDPSDDAEFAAGFVHQVGCQLLSLSIDASVRKDQEPSNRRAGKAWKSVSPESGARASVFLTLAVAAILVPEIEGEKFDQQAIGDGRELVEQIFAVPDTDLKMIEDVRSRVVETLNDELTKDAVERGGLADVMALDMAYSRPPADNIVAYRLVSAANEYLSAASWEWSEIAGTVIAMTADKLSEFREDQTLTLDAIAFGYWVRQAEIEMTEGVNTFDKPYIKRLRKVLAETDKPDTVLAGLMNQVREGLPEPFALGPQVWSEVLDLANSTLAERGQYFLAEASGLEADFDLSRDRREFAFGLGYGLAVTLDALEIEGTQPQGTG